MGLSKYVPSLRFMKRIVFIFILTCIIPQYRLKAQNKLEFVCQSYTASEGLACSQILCMLKDRRDNIWAGSVLGLSRINSLGIRNYSMDDGLSGNLISTLCEDKDGRIWIGSTNGISIFNNNIFTTIDNRLFESKLITAMYCDQSNHMWVAVRAEKMVIYKFDRKFAIVDSVTDLPAWVSSFEEIDGQLVMCTSNGIRPVKNAFSGKLKTFAQQVGDEYVFTVFQSDGKYFVGAKNGLYTWDNIHQVKLLGGCEVIQLAELKGTIYCATSKGLITLKKGVDGQYKMLYPASPELTLFLYGIVIDEEQNIWISSFEKGLLRCRESIAHKIAFSPEVYASNRYSYYHDKKERELLITGRSKSKNHSLIYSVDYPRTINTKEIFANLRIENGHVGSIFHASNNEYWLGVDGYGIVVLDKSGKVIRKYTGDEFERAQYSVWYESSDHRIWAGTIVHGVFCFDEKKEYRHYKISEDFRLNIVQAIYEDDQHNFWIGGDGLACLKNGSFTDYTKELDLNGSIINRITKASNSVAISTMGKGIVLCRLNANDKMTLDSRITTREGLRSNNVTDIAIDANNNIWAAYINGISCVEMRSGKIRSITFFDGDDGLLKNDWDYSGLSMDGDTMFVFTSKGIVTVRPSSLLKSVRQFVARPIITNIGLLYKGDTSSVVFDYRLINDNKATLVNVPYNKNAIAVEYASNSYYHRKDSYYQYMLEGFDDDWHAATQVTTVNYIGLAPGDYTFKVRTFKGQKANKDEANITSFSFVISPPFWQRKWFYVLSILSVIGIITGYIRIRIHNIRKSEAIKTNINKKIGDLELRALQAQLNPHFIFNALNSIQLFVVENNNENAYRYLGKFSKLLRRVLDSSVNSIITIEEEIDLVKLYIEIEALRFDHQFTYEIRYDEGFNYDTVFIPSMLLQPYVENAIKHGLMPKEGLRRLLISISVEGKNIKIVIEDNGIGRKQSGLNKSNNLIYESRGVSLGEDRIKVLKYFQNVDCDVRIEDLYENEIPSGTRIVITLPQDLKLN
jgi:ligand-binding sensor domain-containing protein